ncbi:MAG: T9SS type A sorting domain-containing protein [Chitinophagales bacterium]
MIDEYGITQQIKLHNENQQKYSDIDMIASQYDITVLMGTKRYNSDSTQQQLTKFNHDGDILWTHKYGTFNKRSVPKRIINTSNGGFLIVGYTDNFPTLNGLGYVVRTDSIGTLLWEQTYGDLDSLEAIFDAIEMEDKNYLLLGLQSDGDNNAEFGQNQDIWLIKIDQNGEILWQKKHGSPYYDEVYDIQKVEGGYVMAGVTFEGHLLKEEAIGYVAKIDEEGNILWEKKYAGISYTGKHWGDSFREVRELSDGSLMVMGISRNYNEFFSPMGILVKLTAEGDSLWTKAYHNNVSNHYFWDFEPTEDGGFVMCGWANYGVESGTQDGWVLKVDSLGNTCQPANCDSIFTTSIHYDITTHYPTQFYPNPAQNRVTFQHRLPKGKESVLEVYDLKGGEVGDWVLDIDIDNGELELDLKDWESGLYLYRVRLEREEVSSGKLMVE